jgi:hypothetical protein
VDESALDSSVNEVAEFLEGKHRFVFFYPRALVAVMCATTTYSVGLFSIFGLFMVVAIVNWFVRIGLIMIKI